MGPEEDCSGLVFFFGGGGGGGGDSPNPLPANNKEMVDVCDAGARKPSQVADSIARSVIVVAYFIASILSNLLEFAYRGFSLFFIGMRQVQKFQKAADLIHYALKHNTTGSNFVVVVTNKEVVR